MLKAFRQVVASVAAAYEELDGHGPRVFALADGALAEPDPLEQMAQAEVEDRHLLTLVVCATGATLTLALASSML